MTLIGGRRNKRSVLVTSVILIGVPGVALACPVCFGASESPMAAGVNAGIYVLLAVTCVVLAALGLLAVRVARAQAAATSDEPAAAAFHGRVDVCRVASSDPAEPVVHRATAEAAAGARRPC